MSEHIRRVASPEGAQYYGLPIGAPITADAKAKAKALHGGSEPAGASKVGGNKGGSAKAATSAKEAMSKAASATPAKAPKTKTKLKKPSIKGNMHFTVGKSDYTAPNGSKLFHQKGVDGLAYVQTPDGKVHIFNENGEVETDSKAVLQALSQKFSQDIPADDPDFEVAEFDKVGSHYSLDQMPTGGVLTDQRGNPVFTKNEDGTWHNEDLGIDLDEKSVKPLFDSGDLVPEKTPDSEAMSSALADKEAVNLAELNYGDAVTALENMPEGTTLQAGATKFTKNSDGLWASDDGQKPFPASTLAYAKNDLKPSDGVQVTPDMANDPKGAPSPKTADTPASPAPDVTDRAAASKQAIADANPYKPQPVNWETTYPGNTQYPKNSTDRDLDNAVPGDTMLAAYYNEDSGTSLNDYYDIAVFTKQEDGTWWDQDSIQKLSDLEMGDLANDPDVGMYANKDNKGPEIAQAKAKEARLKAQEDAIKKAKQPGADQPKKLDGSGNKSASTSPDAPAGAPEGMVKGGAIKGDIANYPEGHKVALKFNGKTGKGLASKNVYTKTGPDNWHQDGDPTTFGDKTSQWLKGQQNKSTTLVHEAYADAPATPDVPAEPNAPEKPKSWDALQTGDTPTGEWSKNVGTGSAVVISDNKGSEPVTMKKSLLGDWVSPKITMNETQMAYALDKIAQDENSFSSITVSNKKTSLKKEDVPATPDVPAEPDVLETVNDPKSVGGKPETVDHLKEYPASTTLLYTKKDGKQSTYTKLDNGQYLTPGGQVMAPEQLKNAVKGGKFTVGSLPAQQVAEVDGLDEKYLTPGTPIDKFGVLKQYPEGTVLHSTAVGYAEAKTPLVITKQADGTWSDKNGTYTPALFESDIKHEELYFHSAPQKQATPETVESLTTGDYKTSDVPNLTFDSTGQAYSSQDVKGALDAFENFSGFQLKYAFKGDDKQNPLADKTDDIKAWAKSAYPDLPPKAGAIKLFKDKLGITGTDNSNDQKDVVSGAPNISFGDSGDGIKSTPTGFTGGEFNDQDVQQAIDILEAFNGKAFKNELNKKGNPLGTLSPNHLVGFDKDKTVTKQKFIDLMKQKLASYEANKPNTPEPDPSLSDSALQKAAKDPEEVGDKFGLENIDDMPKGMQFQEADAGLGDDFFTHVGDNLFESADTGLLVQSIDMPDVEYVVTKKPTAAEEAYLNEPDPLEDWEKELLDGTATANPEGYEPHVSFPAEKSVGSKMGSDQKAYEDAPSGTILVSDLGGSIVKHPNGKWGAEGSDPNYGIDADIMAEANNQGSNWSVKHWPEDKPSASTKALTADDLDALGSGAVVHEPGHLDGGQSWEYEKQGDGSWKDTTYGISFTDAQIKTLYEDSANHPEKYGQWILVSEPNPLPDYATTPTAVSMHSGEDGADGPEYNQSGIPVGKYTKGNGKAYMVVHADGSGTYVTGTGNAKKITADAVKKNYDAGMTTFGGIPDTVPEPGTKVSTKTPKTTQPEVNLPDGVYFLGGKDLAETKVFEVKGDEVSVWGDKYEMDSPAYVPQGVGTQKQKLKTKFLNGQVVDAEGDSIVPENHTGSVFFSNKATTIPSLVAVKKKFDAGEIENPLSHKTYSTFSSLGLPIDSQWIAQQSYKSGLTDSPYVPYDVKWMEGSDAEANPQVQAAKKFLSDKLDKLLAGVSMDEPSGDAKQYFTWNVNGEADYPNVGATPYIHGPASDVNPFMKSVQDQFGGPEVMLPVALGKYDKANWIQAFEAGNFANMYKIEVAAAAAKNKSHPKGYLHPGFPGNTETNKITWGAKVKGEHAPGHVPDGNWSGVSPSNWSMDEVNNYLIAAHMQNPTYLSLSERRDWVTYHKQASDIPSFKAKSESLSLEAQKRASLGVPLSEEPVWTDDIKPAKTYDKVFEAQGEFPTNWGPYEYAASTDYATENWSEVGPAIKEFAQNAGYHVPSDGYGEPGEYPSYVIESGLGKYFSAKKEAYEEELKKPVYTTVKAIAAGSHDVYLVKDQFDRQYVFKPADPGKAWRAEVEHMNVTLSKAFGFTTPGSQLIEHEGKFGQMQEFLPNTGNLSVHELADGSAVAFDLKTLTQKQAAAVASEHVLDWILDNDDTHSENMLITPDGGAAGIDKGRGLYVYGNWNGLSLDTKMGYGANTNAQVIYPQVYREMMDGNLSKEHIDAAYKAALKAAKRVQKQPDAKIADMIREGVKNRPNWSPPGYMTHFNHSQAPKNADDLVAAVLDRKANIVNDIDTMWGQIYENAGFEKPTPPAKALGDEHLSGWSESDLGEKIEVSKAFGASPVHASAAVSGGTSLIWTEKQGDSALTKGEMKIGNISQEKILSFLQPKAVNETGMPSAVINDFPNVYLKGVKSNISAAGKDITKNAIDKTYNKDIQDLFDATSANIDKDLEAWSSDMPALTGFHVFPSGTNVPEGALLQYKQALQHYKAQALKVQAAKANGESTNKADFTVFTPTASAPEGKNYVNESTGQSYTQLATGAYLYHDGDSVTSVYGVPDDVKESSDWTALNVDSPDTQGSVAIKLTGAGDYDGSVDQLGNKTVSTTWNSAGHHGQEYEVTLPSGEKIWFRNSSSTGTYKTQQGMLRFQLNPDDEQSASLARVESYLNEMGLNTDGADEDSSESVYWRQMFSRVLLSNGGSAKVQAARNKLQNLKSELQQKLKDNGYLNTSITDYNLPEAIGLTMSPDEEKAFWDGLARETYGDTEVSDWLANGNHLPHYNHLNLEDPTAAAGKAYFKRIDVDAAKLQKNGTLIAIGNNGKDNALLNYISTGGMLSTEERLRIIGKFKQGASSEADQNRGGATGVFARVAKGGAEFQGALFGSHVAYWNPSVFEQIGTYAYNTDSYGDTDYLQDRNKYDPFDSLKYTATDNEVLTQNNLSIFDHLELMIFEDAQKRDEAIQRLKAMNLEMLRGLPIEERLVMRSNYKAAYDKIKAHMKTWSA